ncbi:MAG: TetR/AcrR family transcriptional regulator [Sulfitobacter sp.]
MARPREFDIDDALSDAMNVFWQHGYDAASLPELLKGMGLTRGSLYKAFVDKKSLFLRVLTRYEIEAVQPAVALLTTGSADGLDRINTLFDSVVDAVRNGDQRGCLLCSAAAGPAAVDEDISDVVHLLLQQMQQAFVKALSNAVAYGQSSRPDRENLATLLLTQYVGLRVLVRSNAPIEAVEKSVDALKQMIGAKP